VSKVTLAQLNPTVGDVSGNLAQLQKTVKEAAGDSPDLVVFPEMFLCGYPSLDLLERKAFIREIQSAVHEIVKFSRGFPEIGILFGCPLPTKKNQGKGLYNSALLVSNGGTIAQMNKSLLPTYDVFDETRYFDASASVEPVRFKGKLLGISICEDAWNDPELWHRPIYTHDPIAQLAEKGAELMINISASPFYLGKDVVRFKLIHNHVLRHKVPFIFVNQVGGNDELIFDGTSFVVDASGGLILSLPSFQTAVGTIDLRREKTPSDLS